MADNGNRVLIGLLATAIIFSVGVFVYYEWWPEHENEEDVLSVTYGELEWAFTLTELKALESYTGLGGMRTEVEVQGPNSFTGVPLEALLTTIGIQTNLAMELSIAAIDNYSRTINASIVQGHVEQYDQNGSCIEPNTVPILILAYLENGECIGNDDGPIRVAFVAPEPVYTNSKYWVKQVVRVNILAS
jgi:hypothetical protein